MKNVLYLALILLPLRSFAFPSLDVVNYSVEKALEKEIEKINAENDIAKHIANDFYGIYDKSAYSNFQLVSVKIDDKLSSTLIALKYYKSRTKMAKDIHFKIDNPNGPRGYKDKYEYSCTVVYSATYFEIDDCEIMRDNNKNYTVYGDIGIPLKPKYGGYLSDVYLEGNILKPSL